MPWRRQRDNDVCPLHNEPIRTSGAKYYPLPRPCIKGKKHFQDSSELELCEHLSQHFTGSWNATVRCRLKNVRIENNSGAENTNKEGEEDG